MSTYALPGLVDEEKRELRVGLVMNGGVSLAVWMGGVTAEVDRLRRGDGPYGELLRLTGSQARVDVISGASAGGLNGAMLATAIVHGRALLGLNELWIDKGKFTELFRSPFSPDIPSLLKGDEYFLPALREAFGKLGNGSVSSSSRDFVSLTMTTAVLKGVSTGLADDYGTVIPDTTHLGLFTFIHDDRRHDWESKGAIDGVGPLDRLALAARSCASFPGAFEASFLPVGESLELSSADRRPDMAGHVNFRTSRFAVDGGALMNKPFAPALEAIFAQPAASEVRRVLLYVCPDPGYPESDVADQFDESRPGMAKTVIDSVLTMPRTESIAAELNDIREHNDRVRSFRRTRDILLGVDFEKAATGMWEAYLNTRAESSVDRIVRSLDTGVYRSGATPGSWNRNLARDELLPVRRKFLPKALPGPDTSPAVGHWAWGISPFSTMSMAVLDLFTRALAAAPQGMTDQRAALRAARSKAHEIRLDVGNLRFHDQDFWEHQASAALTAVAGGRQATRDWANKAFAEWERVVAAGIGDGASPLEAADGEAAQEVVASPATQPVDSVTPEPSDHQQGTGTNDQDDPFERLAARAGELASIVVDTRDTLLAVADAVPHKTPLEVGSVIRRNTEALAPPPTGDPVADADAALRRLLALEVALTVYDSSAPSCDQLVELMMISGFVPNAFDGRREPKQKLAGVQLGHFGAFYKAAWRANDWMFGRLDAAYRLATVLLDPMRLRQLGLTTQQALDAVSAIASGGVKGHSAPDDVREWLKDPSTGALNKKQAEEELTYLNTPADDPPPALPECARAVARRLQLEIIIDELPRLREALNVDDAAGALSSSAATFRTLLASMPPPPAPPPPALAVSLFSRCEIGKESVLDDAGSDLFATTITTAAAVAVQAGHSVRSSLGPFRFVFSILRTFVFALYFLTQSAVRSSRSTFAITTLLLGTGAVLVALSLADGTTSPALVAIAWTLVVAGLIHAWWRSGTPKSAGVLVVATAAAVGAAYYFIDNSTAETATVAIALVVVPLATSAITRSYRSWRERPPTVPGGGGSR